jgi:hypothetical protein
VGQESVAETGTRGGTAGQAGNVIDSQVGRYPRPGLILLAQPVEARIGNDDARLLGFDGGIGEVLTRGSATVLHGHGLGGVQCILQGSPGCTW